MSYNVASEETFSQNFLLINKVVLYLVLNEYLI